MSTKPLQTTLDHLVEKGLEVLATRIEMGLEMELSALRCAILQEIEEIEQRSPQESQLTAGLRRVLERSCLGIQEKADVRAVGPKPFRATATTIGELGSVNGERKRGRPRKPMDVIAVDASKMDVDHESSGDNGSQS